MIRLIKYYTKKYAKVLWLTLKDSIHEKQEEEIRRLLYEIKAKGGLSPSRVNRLFKQLESSI